MLTAYESDKQLKERLQAARTPAKTYVSQGNKDLIREFLRRGNVSKKALTLYFKIDYKTLKAIQKECAL